MMRSPAQRFVVGRSCVAANDDGHTVDVHIQRQKGPLCPCLVSDLAMS